MTGVKWHSSASTLLAARKRGSTNVVSLIRAILLPSGVSLRYTGSSPTGGGDIYAAGLMASHFKRGLLGPILPQVEAIYGYLAGEKKTPEARSTNLKA